MDNCIPCGCEDREGINKSDLDRFTDKIDNVLNDDKGKRFFRNFMRTCKMRDGRRKLDLMENIDKIINKRVENEDDALECLLNDAQRIKEFDFALIERLFIARSSENKEIMNEALKLLKTETIKSLTTEYNAFRSNYTPSKSK